MVDLLFSLLMAGALFVIVRRLVLPRPPDPDARE
jgi:hypothetical protein